MAGVLRGKKWGRNIESSLKINVVRKNKKDERTEEVGRRVE